MSIHFKNDIERLKFLRKFVTGFEAKDGWKISGGRIYAPEHYGTKKQREAAYEDFHDRVGAILAATATPYKVVHSRKPENRHAINRISSVNIEPERMKVAILRAETSDESKLKTIHKDGYSVSEGVYQKYYIHFSAVRLMREGSRYLKELVNKHIPHHYKKAFKMLSTFGNVEFNGTFENPEGLAYGILQLANKYMSDVESGRFIRSFVVYAFNPLFVDEDALEQHINNYMEVRTRSKAKRARQRKFRISEEDEEDNE